MLPPLSVAHLRRLTDETGVLQFARFGVQDPASGYATDDNARALVVAARLPPLRWRETLARTTLGFLLYAQRQDGTFVHLIRYDRRPDGRPGSEDCLGRCAWACGEVVASSLPDSLRRTAEFILHRVWPHLDGLRSCRGQANAILGLTAYCRATGRPEAKALATVLGDRLLRALDEHSGGEWVWFEDILTYEPGRLPAALWDVYRLAGLERFRRGAEETTGFLERTLHLPVGGGERVLVPVGNRGWYPRGGPRAWYDQQPVDAGSLVELYVVAAETTGETRYRRLAEEAFGWFAGRNTAGAAVYDPRTGACHDGLHPGGVNLNCGAEATITFLLARLSLGRLLGVDTVPPRPRQRAGFRLRPQPVLR
ncbi:MAG: hypothetical protein QN155_01515 [Armatimonadota bacterium]|nr:hypothetical protein [Armatimonadota bacterium]MDR7404184.1 hypothetical protein [Armatimonadota bacterium]